MRGSERRKRRIGQTVGAVRLRRDQLLLNVGVNAGMVAFAREDRMTVYAGSLA